MILDFLQCIKIERSQTFSMKCYLLYTRRRRIGVRIVCVYPNIISSLNIFCDHDSHCLQTLFYQFFKISTSLNFIESDQTLHDATPGLGLLPSAMFAKSDKLQTLGKTKKMPTLVSLC